MNAPLILVADDNPEDLDLLTLAMQAAGFDVLQAHNGDEAEKLALEHHPDLTILDLRMPLKDGFEVAASLRNAGLPFISLSSYGEEEMVERATDAGSLAYLVKPLEADQLVPAVQAALRRADDMRHMKESMEQMDKALSQSREISMVVGILMERCGFTAIQAFDAMRDEARSQRRKIADVAREYFNAAEALHGMTRNIAERAREKAQRSQTKRPPKRGPARIIS
ncbi:response regulator receiver and ANTAR domain protein [Thiogranum longum]|uniref:Response regulator receiver and ANTAR domain protein n=1 Tax=Thiogranum longum TaxID=1537524 RepID=A0A4R1HBF7_9GAMM|nr:response regulator [Thiogranum longum]TCK17853.1 response regulator receiver and ANTAR domain protein [Thiogranum longum]